MKAHKEETMPENQEVVIRLGCIFVTGDPELAERSLNKFFHETFNNHYSNIGLKVMITDFVKINETEINDQTTSFIPNNLWFDVESSCQESARKLIKETFSSNEFISLSAKHNVDIDWFDFD